MEEGGYCVSSGVWGDEWWISVLDVVVCLIADEL